MIREPLPSFAGVVLAAALGACATAPEPAPARAPPSPAPRTPSALPAEVPAGAHRIAALQYEIRSRRAPSDILAELDVAVGRAAAAGAELVLLPELFVLDVWPASVEDEPAFVRRVARDTTPVLLEGLAAVARDHGAAVLAGSVPELRGEGLFNTAYLFFPDGRHVRQDKMYLTAWGKRVGMTPGRRLETFDAPWGRTVILVCYDVEIPSLSARLVATRPEVILVPSMTESTHGYHRVRWAAQARAVEHHAYVVVAGTVGTPSPDWPHFGQAAFLTPRDAGFPGLLAEGPYNAPALVLADLDLEKLRASRASASFYPAKDVELHRAAGPREE